YIYTDARTGGTINGSNESDDNIKEVGGYIHSVTHLSSKLDFVGAVRLDKHSRLDDAVFSPRAAVVFKPADNQSFRVTFNRAFSTPSNNNLFLDIVAGRIPPTGTKLYDVRALGVPQSGFTFRGDAACANGIGALCMRTPFNPAAGNLPARAAPLWAAAVQAVSALVGPQLTALMLSAPPSNAQVGTQLRLLNPTTGTWADINDTQVRDIGAIQPTISHQFEVGYKALIKNRFQISVDAWHERKRNFTGPLIVESPNVFLDRAGTITYLTALFTQAGVPNAAATAAQVGTGMAGLSGGTAAAGTTGVPLGTVVPTNTPLTARPDIFLTYRNFGKVTLWGADLAMDMVFGKHFSLAGGYSFVNKDFFPKAELDNAPTDIALNASKSKGSITAGWRDDQGGWNVEGRLRAVKGFPVNSGVYVSAPDPSDPSRLLPTDSYGVVDFQGSWRPPLGSRNMLFSANIQNLLNKHYATFVGVPRMGRVLLTKLTYTF
ncbi:MAG TPA: TonB-dependent receptor, partial [Gemmatimonadales bacterium]|nr:TonB-dependent receptor [Gemmatimonadales bacterium]